jgi:hypothetical protein
MLAQDSSVDKHKTIAIDSAVIRLIILDPVRRRYHFQQTSLLAMLTVWETPHVFKVL